MACFPDGDQEHAERRDHPGLVQPLEVLLRAHVVDDEVEQEHACQEQLEVDERSLERIGATDVVERQHAPQQHGADREVGRCAPARRTHPERDAQQPDDEHEQDEGQVGAAEDRSLGVGQHEHEQVDGGHHAEPPRDTEHEQRGHDGDDALVRRPVLDPQQDGHDDRDDRAHEAPPGVLTPRLGGGLEGTAQIAHRCTSRS